MTIAPTTRRDATTAASVGIGIGLGLVVAVVFARTAGFAFLNLDDDQYVTANPYVSGGLSWASVRWAFTAFHSGHWHPLTWLSLAADATLFGPVPGPMHLVNVALHALTTVLLYAVLYAATGARGPSALVAALFGLHPLRVESVAWVTERKDVLSACCWVLTMGAYVRYVRRPAAGRYGAVVLALALGLLAKPMLVTLPVVLLLLDWWPLGRFAPSRVTSRRASLPGLVVEKLPLLVLAAVASAVTAASQRAAGATVSLGIVPLDQRLANAALAYVRYLGMTFWPVDLAVFYPLVPVSLLGGAAAAGVLLVLTALALGVARRHPYVTVGWLWFVITLAPVIGIVQIGGQALADRFTYLPHIGLFLALVFGGAALVRARRWSARVATALVGTALAATTVLTWRQLGHWRDDESLLRHALAVTADNYLAHNNLGVALAARGRHDEAAEHYAQAVRINPTWPEARNNLGNAWAARGDYGRARAQFEEALRVRPDFAVALNNLGTALAREGRFADAIAPYTRAVVIEPDYFDARFALADTLARLGRTAEAIVHYEILLRARPDWTEGHTRLTRLRTLN